MKILQFGNFYPPSMGGTQQVMFEVSEGVSKKDDKVLKYRNPISLHLIRIIYNLKAKKLYNLRYIY